MTRVLVVEDDTSVRSLLETVLTAEGYDVDTAADGVAGLSRAQRERYDCVLLDLMMPDLGGLRVLDEIAAAEAPSPVLVVTGQDEAAAAARARLGADRVLAKPFAVEDLIGRVAALTGGPR